MTEEAKQSYSDHLDRLTNARLFIELIYFSKESVTDKSETIAYKEWQAEMELRKRLTKIKFFK